MSVALHVVQSRAEGMIGASDAACALGFDRYKSPLTLWKELRGIARDEKKPQALEEAAECGQLLEPIVRGKYALLVNRAIVVPTKSVVHDGWLRCTPDGYVLPENQAPTFALGHTYEDDESTHYHIDGLLQCKTASAFKREEWELGVPTEYEIQERVEMAICGLPWADVFCLVGGQRWFGPLRVERDGNLEDRILTDLAAFSRLVREGIEPTPDHTAAWLAHASERLSKLRARVTLDADDEARAEVELWRAARRRLDTAKEEVDGLKNKILLRMASAGATALQLDRDVVVTAYQVGLKPHWKEYCLSLGGQKKPPTQFMGTKNSWALRAPDDEDHHE